MNKNKEILEKRKKYKRKRKRSVCNNRRRRISDSDTGSSSSTSSPSEEEWIEKEKPCSSTTSRDAWMSETCFVPTCSLKDRRKKETGDKQSKQNSAKEAPAVGVGRELNPYWIGDGGGLPKDYNDDGKPRLASHTVGDQGVEWLKKALRRAEEKAREENRSLESVAAERYGSLKTLYEMIYEAENRNRSSKRGWRSGPSNRSRSKDRCPDTYSREFSSQLNSKFRKPADYNKTEDCTPSKRLPLHSRQGWKKQEKYENSADRESKLVNAQQNPAPPTVAEPVEEVTLTDAEMNSLASKIVKAEIIGNKSLVEELKKKLENARKVRDTAKLSASCDANEVIILTKINTHGVHQPIRGKMNKKDEKKKRKYETHVDGERVRYFEDDEKYSLTEMFEKERVTSSADSNAEFIRLSSKSKSDKDHAIDDLFMEQNTSNKSDQNDKNIRTSIDKQRSRERILDNCLWCLANNKLQKHLIISTGLKSYLSLPFFKSLTENHCIIAPIYHATCSTLLDEDVWEEIMEYCNKLLRIFSKNNFDVVFFETATNFKQYPHMMIHCVPIPFENSNLAPIYFKKAIMECEKEWALNKKLVDIQKMNVRHAIPKGLPYFMVNFGLDNGYAHVIEDERYFPKNFAQEIIGGMLDLDHSVWRKSRPDDFESQCKKVNNFKKIWEP